MSGVPIFFQGEVMLLRWGDNSTNGRTITLQLDSEGDRHPFSTLKSGAAHGQRIALVAVLIGDDERPQNAGGAQRSAIPTGPDDGGEPAHPPEARAEDRERPRVHFKDMKRSAQAALKCQGVEFQKWVSEKNGLDSYGVGIADTLVKNICGITSKTELDTDPAKGDAWLALLTEFDCRSSAR